MCFCTDAAGTGRESWVMQDAGREIWTREHLEADQRLETARSRDTCSDQSVGSTESLLSSE